MIKKTMNTTMPTWKIGVLVLLLLSMFTIVVLIYINLNWYLKYHDAKQDWFVKGNELITQVDLLAQIHHELDSYLYSRTHSLQQHEQSLNQHDSPAFLAKISALKEMLQTNAQRDALNTIELAFYVSPSEFTDERHEYLIDAFRFLNQQFSNAIAYQENQAKTFIAESDRNVRNTSFFVVLLALLGCCLAFVVRYLYLINEQLKSTLVQVDTLIDENPDVIFMVDYEGRIRRANNKVFNVFGYKPQELIGISVELFIPNEFRHRHEQLRSRFNQSDAGMAMGARRDLLAVTKSGEIIDVEISISRMPYLNQRMYCLTLRDVTQNRLKEEQLQHSRKMDSIGQLTAGVAHDFNNLLAVIAGNAQLIDEHNEDNHLYVSKISSAVQKAKELTQRLLAFGRKQLLSTSVVDVNQLLNDMENRLKRTVNDQTVIEMTLDKPLWLINIDPRQFSNVIMNLILNAKHALPKGGHILIVTQNISFASISPEDIKLDELRSASGNYVLIQVRDNGCGIPPEVLEKVFEPFFTTKGIGNGSGLGLSMVYGFVKQSKGHIVIDSEPDCGTTVSIYLPVAKQDKSDKKEDNAKANVPENKASDKKNSKLLVVEDDPEVRMIQCQILKIAGYDFDEAVDGEEAINLLKSHHYDLLFTDVMLPGALNGVDVANEARKLNPDIRILFATGYMQESDFASLDNQQQNDILHKPFRREELLGKINELLTSRIISG
ncbi:response regulator [Paraneptunicella aestuarii]|uniref:hybrid sensor histidine kinase/response regulator n=1 Tax=Paraneptunicella aestuarii TaxID=2831148 RepID=UPI001E5938B9|nr:ATP-binding protein [Paraneptunicella aestuarii]UAA40578.1 response regulator [Paraneptunicella aestuarii]